MNVCVEESMDGHGLYEGMHVELTIACHFDVRSGGEGGRLFVQGLQGTSRTDRTSTIRKTILRIPIKLFMMFSNFLFCMHMDGKTAITRACQPCTADVYPAISASRTVRLDSKSLPANHAK